jgi:hypothetical protein
MGEGGNPAEKEAPPVPDRPNAEYQLSNRKTGDDELNFRYSREQRLAKAPKPVQELYTAPSYKFSLLKPLTGSKPRAAMFVSIVLLCAAILVISILGYADEAHTLGGNRVLVQAVKYEGATIVILKKTIKNANQAYTGAVDLAVSPAVPEGTEDYPIFVHRVFFSLQEEEEYRFAVPFDSDELVLVFQYEENTLAIKIKAE